MTAPDAFQAGVEAHRRGDHAKAERLYRRAMEDAPMSADCRLNLGILLRNLGRPHEARPVLEEGLRLAPARTDLRFALGLVLLMLGDYAAGWPLYENRREVFKVAFPDLPVPEWKGEPLAGKRIAVFPEQGLGDAIQFARFLPLLRQAGAQALLLCKPALEPLFAGAFEGVEVQSLAGEVQLGALDYWAPILSIPGRLGLALDAVPSAPYLRAADPQPLSPRAFRVGLTTQGNPRHQNDARRSLDQGQAARLRALSGVETVSLHPEDSGAADFMRTADIVSGLDLVVSVDSAVCHLAGALGKPTLLLLPGYGVDWRWMTDRGDSPWYPNHRLFRSAVDGDWSAALAQVEHAVDQLRAAKLTKGPPPPT